MVARSRLFEFSERRAHKVVEDHSGENDGNDEAHLVRDKISLYKSILTLRQDICVRG